MTRERVLELARTRYRGVNDSHLAELLGEDEGIIIARSSLQRLLRGAGIGTTRKRRAPKYRSRRERMPQAGLLVQIDGSPHAWLEDRGPRLTLVGAIDDATGTFVAATFCAVEDGRAYLTILARIYGAGTRRSDPRQVLGAAVPAITAADANRRPDACANDRSCPAEP